MKVISEFDLNLRCDYTKSKCTRAAFYICIVAGAQDIARFYCPKHAAELLQRGAEIVAEQGDGFTLSLHDLILIEHLISGQVINA